MRVRTLGRSITNGCLLTLLMWTAGCGERQSASSPTAPPREAATVSVPPARPAAAGHPAPPSAEPSSTASEVRVQAYDSSTLTALSEEDASYRPYEPVVTLTTQHAETCLLQVGETFPDVVLQTLDGSENRLLADLGERLTVVVFWDAQHPMAVEQIRRLEAEVARRYSTIGLHVVAIHVGELLEDQRDFLSQLDPSYTVLQDPDGQVYAQVATGLMPRTYLLDPQGRVLWLDVEYSRSFRRDLRNAILYHLRQQRQATDRRSDTVM